MEIHLSQNQDGKRLYLKDSTHRLNPNDEIDTAKLQWTASKAEAETLTENDSPHELRLGIEEATEQETYMLFFHKGVEGSVAYNSPTSEFVLLTKWGIDTAPTLAELIKVFINNIET